MYGFTGDKYLVTFWFNPSYANDCPINVQDRIGWLGEAMVNNANPKLLDSSGNVPATISGPVPGLKILKKTFILTRADILGTTRKVFE
jgi:hypothetical protein